MPTKYGGVIQGISVCLVRSRLVRVLQMVSGDKFRHVVEFCGKEPRGFFVGTCISSPVDKV